MKKQSKAKPRTKAAPKVDLTWLNTCAFFNAAILLVMLGILAVRGENIEYELKRSNRTLNSLETSGLVTRLAAIDSDDYLVRIEKNTENIHKYLHNIIPKAEKKK